MYNWNLPCDLPLLREHVYSSETYFEIPLLRNQVPLWTNLKCHNFSLFLYHTNLFWEITCLEGLNVVVKRGWPLKTGFTTVIFLSKNHLNDSSLDLTSSYENWWFFFINIYVLISHINFHVIHLKKKLVNRKLFIHIFREKFNSTKLSLFESMIFFEFLKCHYLW